MGKWSRYTVVWLVLLACMAVPHYVKSVWATDDIWFISDELAHYDYIDQLSSGRLPHPRDGLTDYTIEITADHFGFPDGLHYDGTRESLGVVGRSYEAQQPPLYYLLLAPPNYVLKKLNVAPPTLIRILRSFNVVVYIGMAVFILLTFRELSMMLGLDPLLGYIVACLAISVRFVHRHHISNDHLPALAGACAFYLGVRLWRTGRHRYMAWSCLAAVLAFLTKYTAGLLLAFWGLNTLFFYRRRGWRGWRTTLLHFAPLGALVLHFAGNARLYGVRDILGLRAADEVLWAFTKPNLNLVDVLRDLFARSVDLRPVVTIPTPVALMLLGVMGLSYALSFYRLFIRDNRNALPLFLACQVSVMVVLLAVVLNPYTTGIPWFFFRFWEAYGLCWYTALVATPFLVETRWLKTAGIALTVSALTWMTYVWL